ncbi:MULTISPECIES: DUF3232 domain-containing protein [Clostridium]|jgi:uncharacterized protein YutE (UPF0331/DUF86 family)|uniref:DUF3232 domain-containing protein n=1 Tax=Clostridium TaxID=1485 RepID=UPI00242E81D6|nr:DUF3232 domain-containing protein [Clostridium tyrobutyricum]
MARIKESVKELMAKVDSLENDEDKEMEKELIDSLAKDCADYISAISDMENAINIGRFTLEGDDYRDCIANLDKNRMIKHNVVISGVKVLNRLCLLNGLKPIFQGDTNSRIQVADFAKEYVDELYGERKL